MRPTQASDLHAVNGWHQARGWPGLSPHHLEMTGYIVEDVAAGFVMQTDAGIAFLENYISNPDARPRDVAKAVDQISEALMGFAKDAGFEYIGALTVLRSIQKRAKRLGLSLHDTPYAMLSKAL